MNRFVPGLLRPQNQVALPGEVSESLIGGPCDGLLTRKTTEPVCYAGRYGNGLIYVYRRAADGKLHYSETTTPAKLTNKG